VRLADRSLAFLDQLFQFLLGVLFRSADRDLHRRSAFGQRLQNPRQHARRLASSDGAHALTHA
jgi:hypothetical protein